MSSFILPFHLSLPSDYKKLEQLVFDHNNPQLQSKCADVLIVNNEYGCNIVCGEKSYSLFLSNVIDSIGDGSNYLYLLCKMEVETSEKATYVIHKFSLDEGLFFGEPFQLTNLTHGNRITDEIRVYFVGIFHGILMLHIRDSSTILIVDLSRPNYEIFDLQYDACDVKLYNFDKNSNNPSKLLVSIALADYSIKIHDWKERVLLYTFPLFTDVSLSKKFKNARLSKNLIWSGANCRMIVLFKRGFFVNDVKMNDRSVHCKFVNSNLTHDLLGCILLSNQSFVIYSENGQWKMFNPDISSSKFDYEASPLCKTILLYQGCESGLNEVFILPIRSSAGLVCHFEISIEENKISELLYCPHVQNIPQKLKIQCTCIKSLVDQYLLVGFNDGSIKMYPIATVFNGIKDQPIREYVGHQSAVSCFLVPSLGIQESNDDTKPLIWFLSGSEDGSIRLWDINGIECLHVFHAHTYPIVSIHQPPPEKYKEILDLTKDNMVTAADIQKTLAEKRKSTSSKSTKYFRSNSQESLVADTSKSSSLSSLNAIEAHSATHRLLQTLFRCFYAIVKDGTVVVLDWDQSRVGWWLSGLSSDDLPIYIECMIPLINNFNIWCKNESVAYNDLNMKPDDGHLVIKLSGKKNAVYWLLDRTGGLCISQETETFSEDKFHTDSLRIAKIGDFNAKASTVYSILSIQRSNLAPNGYIMFINLKNLHVCHEKVLANLGKHNNSIPFHTFELTKALFSLLYPWNINEKLDECLNDLSICNHSNVMDGYLDCKMIVKSTGNRYVLQQQQIVDNLPNAVSYFRKSPTELACRILSMLILLRIFDFLSSHENIISKISSFLTTNIYDELISHSFEFSLPSLSLIAKYYNDPFPVFQSCSRSLFISSLQLMTLESLDKLFDNWYPCLPSIQITGRKAMARACVILSAIVYEESLSSKTKQEYAILGIKRKTISHCVNTLRPSVSLSPQSEQQLVLSVLSLLISSQSPEYNQETHSIIHKDVLMYRSIAVEFIGLLWHKWEYFLRNLTIGHLASSLAVSGKAMSTLLPLHVFVLRKLWNMSTINTKDNMENKESGLPDHVVYHGDRRKSSFGRRRNRLVIGDDILNDSFDIVNENNYNQENSAQNLNSTARKFPKIQTARPILLEKLETIYGDERLPSMRHLVHAARNSLIEIARKCPMTYIHTLCSELLNSGLRDGDWERVRLLLKAGVGIILKHHPIAFFPNSLSYLIEAIIKGCLDPNIPFTIRENLSHTVTVILHEIIRIYPNVSFHAASQKLCIGTGFDNSEIPDYMNDLISQGELIIWDLKTATRVQIIEAHKPHNVAAVAFNKVTSGLSEKTSELLLASYSIEDGCVKFYQHSGFFSTLASSITSSFSSSRPSTPDQGLFTNLAGGGQLKVFRTFKVDEIKKPLLGYYPNTKVPITAIENLQKVKLEWESERSVKLYRPEPFSTLTFNI